MFHQICTILERLTVGGSTHSDNDDDDDDDFGAPFLEIIGGCFVIGRDTLHRVIVICESGLFVFVAHHCDDHWQHKT